MELIEACLYSRTAVLKHDWDPFRIHYEKRVSFSLNIVRHFLQVGKVVGRVTNLFHIYSPFPFLFACLADYSLVFFSCVVALIPEFGIIQLWEVCIGHLSFLPLLQSN